MVEFYNLYEEFENKLSETEKNLEAMEMLIELLRENCRNTYQENQELMKENAFLKSEIYGEQPFDFD